MAGENASIQSLKKHVSRILEVDKNKIDSSIYRYILKHTKKDQVLLLLLTLVLMPIIYASLEVPLPLPYDLYVSDFESTDSVEEFKVMVGQAEYYYEMPMRFGNVRELARVDDTHGNESRNKQYALAGAYVIQRCNLLLAIYDGEHEAGTGGTGQIVRWYNEGGIPPEFLYPGNYFLGPEQQASVILKPNP